MKDAIITRHEPHCIVWVRATASVWGNAPDHDLDEPVALTEAAPVRIRYVFEPGRGDLIIDRALRLKALRAGTGAAMRFTFANGTFFEMEIPGVRAVASADHTIEVRP